MPPVWTYYVLCVIPVFSYMIIYDSPSTWSWSMININVDPSLIYEHSQPSTNTMSTQCIQLVEHSPNNPPHRTPCPSSYSFLYPKFAPPATGGMWGLRYSSYQRQHDWSYFESCLCTQTHTHTHTHTHSFHWQLPPHKACSYNQSSAHGTHVYSLTLFGLLVWVQTMSAPNRCHGKLAMGRGRQDKNEDKDEGKW